MTIKSLPDFINIFISEPEDTNTVPLDSINTMTMDVDFPSDNLIYYNSLYRLTLANASP